MLAWQNTEDATETFPKHRPKPVPRPGDEDKPPATSAPLMGGTSASVMSVEEFQRRLVKHQQRIEERRAARGH